MVGVWVAYEQPFLIICCCYCSGKTPKAPILEKSAWLSHLLGGKASPTTCVRNWRCYPHTGFSWFLSSSPSPSVQLSIQGKSIGVIWSALQGTQFHVDVTPVDRTAFHVKLQGFINEGHAASEIRVEGYIKQRRLHAAKASLRVRILLEDVA